jgi:acetyl-CoA synthetase (ADP-forming)
VLAEVALRLAPLSQADAYEMLGQTRAAALLGPVRGWPAVDTGVLVRVLLALSRLALERQDIAAVDINPLVVEGAQPLAVDALVLIDDR